MTLDIFGPTVLGDLCDYISGVTFTKSHASKSSFENSILILRSNNIDNGINFDDTLFVDQSHVSAEQHLIAGDILICMSSGSKSHVGKSALITNLSTASFGAFCGVLRPKNTEHSEYLSFYMQSEQFRQELRRLSAGSNINNLKKEHILDQKIKLPQIDQLKNDVAHIKSSFDTINSGLTNLVYAERQLELYRQSVLKDAFEGKLTADWRSSNPDLVEPADKLLARIETERKAAHQAELDAWEDAVNLWEANGKDGKKPSKPKMVVIDHKQAIDFSSESSPYLMCYLSHLGDFGRGKSKHRPRNDPNLYGGDYPFIQTGDVGNSLKKITEYSKTYNEFGLAQSKLWPSGTLCITIAANIADTAFLSFDACFPDSVVGFTMNRNLLNPDYVYYFFEHVQERLESYAPATAQKNINLQILNEVLIPFCSLHEQKVIVEKLENNNQIINQNKRTIRDNLKKANALKQSILKQAFSGHELLEDAS